MAGRLPDHAIPARRLERHAWAGQGLAPQRGIGNQAALRRLARSPAAGQPPRRKCAACEEQEHAAPHRPRRKEPNVDLISDSDDEFAAVPQRRAMPEHPEAAPDDGLPHQGSATIVCDGSGGYRVSMGWAATATCGIGDCVRQHEQSHAADWRGRFPDGCRNADGSAKADGTQVPTGGPGYDAFLRQSECRAYGIEIPCEERLLAGATADCRPVVQDVLDDSRRQRTRFC